MVGWVRGVWGTKAEDGSSLRCAFAVGGLDGGFNCDGFGGWGTGGGAEDGFGSVGWGRGRGGPEG